jgi:hypothetical protein
MTTTQKIIFTPEAPQDKTVCPYLSGQSIKVEWKEKGNWLPAIFNDWQSASDRPWRGVIAFNGRIISDIAPECIRPAKPADAHAADAHTPMAGDTERLLQIGQLTRDRDQAREQVKTLLAACKGIISINAVNAVINYAELNNITTPAYEQVKAVRAAIASVESEGQ